MYLESKKYILLLKEINIFLEKKTTKKKQMVYDYLNEPVLKFLISVRARLYQRR